MKPFLSDKIVSKEQILLVENKEIISEDSKIDYFFSNFAKNLKIPGYKPHDDSLFENVSYPILQVILKYRNHPIILTIVEDAKTNQTSSLYFHFQKLLGMKY